MALIADMQYNMRHAFLAYGPGVTGILQESLSLLFQSQARMLTECLNISAKDILMDTCSLNRSRSLSNVINRPHQPAFYLIVDHKRNKIVLSIRGSASIGDFITDLHWDCTKWTIDGTTGHVFEGWLRAAQHVHKSVTNTLVDACRKYAKYQVVITGHSMGAGAAGLLGLMYKDNSIIRGQDGQRLKVWCFAAPSVVSREFVDQKLGNDYITSVTLDTDAATRMSPEAIKIWNLRQELISEYSTDKIKDILQRDEISGGDEGAKLLRILKNVRSPNPEHELFPLGRILWFVPRIVLDDDIVSRRKTLMKMSEDHDDSITDDESEEAVCGTISSDETSEDGGSGSEGKQSAFQSEFGHCGDELLSDDEEDQKESFHRIRRRPMDQSSDEEEDDDDNDHSQTLTQSIVQNAAVQNNLFIPRHQIAAHSGDALIEELIKMKQDRETAAKCPVAPKAYKNMNPVFCCPLFLDLLSSIIHNLNHLMILTQSTVKGTNSGIVHTDSHRTERKDDFREDQIEEDQVQNMGMYRIRRRPMDQSSDEEDDDEEGATVECTSMTPFPDDEVPILDGITGSMERLKSTVQTTLHLKIDDQRKERLQQSGYVLCDATESRNIFTEFIFEPKFLDLHMGQCYMWVCGATLKLEK